MPFKWGLLALGGILGTVGRYLLSGAVYRWMGTAFPYGTLVVNVSGCLVIGFLGTLADKKFLLGPDARLFVMIGLLGAFTTFSSLIYESWKLFQDGQLMLGAVNLAGSIVLGLAAFWIGSLIASLF